MMIKSWIFDHSVGVLDRVGDIMGNPFLTVTILWIKRKYDVIVKAISSKKTTELDTIPSATGWRRRWRVCVCVYGCDGGMCVTVSVGDERPPRRRGLSAGAALAARASGLSVVERSVVW